MDDQRTKTRNVRLNGHRDVAARVVGDANMRFCNTHRAREIAREMKKIGARRPARLHGGPIKSKLRADTFYSLRVAWPRRRRRHRAQCNTRFLRSTTTATAAAAATTAVATLFKRRRCYIVGMYAARATPR